MIRIYIYVEGQTEESFVYNVLQPAYPPQDIQFTPIIATTKAAKGSLKAQKGGIVSYQKAKTELQRLCLDSEAWVTTMIDFYGLPDDFPGSQKARKASESDVYQTIDELEIALQRDIEYRNFFPYYQLHEFEALLFTEPAHFASCANHSAVSELHSIKKQFDTPEHINNSPETAPSKRIEKLIPGYDKIAEGTRIAQATGLTNIRQQCLHFNTWLTHIESLAKGQES